MAEYLGGFGVDIANPNIVYSKPGCSVSTKALKNMYVKDTMALSICSSLNDKNKQLSEKEFEEWVESIVTIESKELRKKMTKALFMHLATILTSSLR